jgi:uncharacterized membrane protein YjgN (DUF898 family)
MTQTNDLEPANAPVRLLAPERRLDDTLRPTYDGKFGQLLALCLKSLFLSIVTLGFYRFWGRTRIRKYLWSRVSLGGERFEYDGTGGELFRRFIVTLIVLSPIFVGPGLVKLAGASAGVSRAVDSAQGIVLLILAYFGYYTGRRYRLSRTTWRGIRGGLEGRAGTYSAHAVKSNLLSLITLGLYGPWQRVRLWRYEADNTRFGERFFAFTGSGRELFPAYIMSLVMFGAACAIIGFVGYGTVMEHARLVAQKKDLGGVYVTGAFLVIMIPVSWTLAMLLYEAGWLSFQAERTQFGDVTLRADFRAWPLLRLRLGNLCLMLVTLGLGWPFVAQRTLRFLCRAIEVEGASSLDSLVQQPGAERPPAEGLAQLLDSGGIA